MNFLSVTGINKKINDNIVLQNIDFTQKRLQKIAIAGETGSGKSTLLKIIAGLVQPDAGEIFFEMEKVPGPEEKLMPGHKHIAYLSQHFELLNNYKVEEVLSMANKLADNEAGLIYEVCRIDHLLKRKTDQLSGGEKQRIAAAKLLIASPRLLLLDEPYSNLDIAHRNILKAVISDISEKLAITCIMISHDPADILSWADEIIAMKNGQILQKGSPQQIYQKPVDKYVAGLFGKYNLINVEMAEIFFPSKRDLDEDFLITRPENFKIATEESGAFEGKVNKVSFFGSYYEIEVLQSGNIITLKTGIAGIVKGDKVFILPVSDAHECNG